MSTRGKKKGESTDEASGQGGVPVRRHYEYAPSESNQGTTQAARSKSSNNDCGQAHAQRPPDAGAIRKRSVKE
jgi:hypothetical protein